MHDSKKTEELFPIVGREVQYEGEHGVDSGFHWIYKVKNDEGGWDEVQIYPEAYDDSDGNKLPWRVVWEGAMDFEGTKTDLLKRYPEFKGEL